MHAPGSAPLIPIAREPLRDPATPLATRGPLARILLGSVAEAAWVRPAFVGVVVLSAVLYTWNLTVSGYANTYYSAAALAASQSWSAWFFGSIDAANFITIDKPPLSTMLMGLSVRLFGLSSWSILLPQALAGVATVVVLFAAVRRSFGPVAAAVAGLVMALMPVAVLIFRYNNPDALLTLLLVGAAWAFVRGLENGRLRWPILAAALVGLAFLTKYLQAYLVLPAFASVWLVAAPGSLRRRVVGLLLSAVTVAVTSAWWVAIVELIPTADRPYIGGSTNDSALDLLFGYNGLGRIFGAGEGGPGGGPGGGALGFGGETGILRLFNAQFGGQVSWLVPLALVGLGAGLWLTRRAPRTDAARAGYLLWGLWFGVHALVFSFMSGIIHPYYTVTLAPAVAALAGAGVVDLWRSRSRVVGRLLLVGAIAATAWWSRELLARTPDFAPGLGVAVLAVAVPAGALLLVPPARIRFGRLPPALMSVALAALLAGPAAYAVETIGTAHAGGDPAAGPRAAAGGPGAFPGDTGGPGRLPGGGPGRLPGGLPGGLPGSGGPSGASLFGQAISDDVLIGYLVANRGDATWIVAVAGSQQAGSIGLASGLPVMAMGGFMGADPAPTLEELRGYVASGRLRYVLVGGFGPGGRAGPGGSSDVASERDAWVTDSCAVVDYGGSSGTLYDCAGAG